MLRWKKNGRDRNVEPGEVRALEQRRFKARGELLTFAARHLGALSGFFLGMVHQRLSHGLPKRLSDLRKVSVQQWAQGFTGLTEVRDLREVATLAAAMDMINVDDLEQAMDILSQRILAVQQAKRKGGSWGKAEAIELTPSAGSGAAASGVLRLTASGHGAVAHVGSACAWAARRWQRPLTTWGESGVTRAALRSGTRGERWPGGWLSARQACPVCASSRFLCCGLEIRCFAGAVAT